MAVLNLGARPAGRADQLNVTRVQMLLFTLVIRASLKEAAWLQETLDREIRQLVRASGKRQTSALGCARLPSIVRIENAECHYSDTLR